MVSVPEALEPRDDLVIDQGWAEYGELDNAIWRRPFERQLEATRPDFTPYYETLKRLPDVEPAEVLAENRLIELGA